MTEIKPQFLDELSYAAKFDRQFPRDILTEGIVATDDLEVTELDTPGMGVKVAAGVGYVQGDQSTTQGHYRIYNDASKNLTIAASDPTNPRKDRIIAQIYDSIDIGGAEDKWVLEVLTGTPAPSPDPPALPDDALDLAIILVGNGVTEILNANITDQRERISLQNIILTNVKARAYLSADQSNIPDSTSTKILLNAESYDIGKDFDIANSKFVVPETGFYQINAIVTWGSTVADKRYVGYVFKNGGILIQAQNQSSISTYLSCPISDIRKLTAGDYIELYCYHASGAATPDIASGAGMTFMAIHLLSRV